MLLAINVCASSSPSVTITTSVVGVVVLVSYSVVDDVEDSEVVWMTRISVEVVCKTVDVSVVVNSVVLISVVDKVVG